MELHEELKGSLKDALKAKEGVKLRTVRSILTALTNEMVATGKTPQDSLENEAVTAVIKRLAKQRKESITQFESAGRDELATPEKEELEVLERYLPTLMTQVQIEPFAKAKLTELKITDISKIGIAIGALKKELGEKTDGSDIKAVIEKLLS